MRRKSYVVQTNSLKVYLECAVTRLLYRVPYCYQRFKDENVYGVDILINLYIHNNYVKEDRTRAMWNWRNGDEITNRYPNN